MLYPTGILSNQKTGRFHPISFEPYPAPGGSDLPRYKSVGHHTDGFDTIEEAKAWVAEHDSTILITQTYDWDGEKVPAIVDVFDLNLATADPQPRRA